MEIDDGVVRGPEPTALNRRRFLGTAGALLGSSWLAGLPGCSERREGLDQARRRAVERRRRLILDDDGDLVYCPRGGQGSRGLCGAAPPTHPGNPGGQHRLVHHVGDRSGSGANPLLADPAAEPAAQ